MDLFPIQVFCIFFFLSIPAVITVFIQATNQTDNCNRIAIWSPGSSLVSSLSLFLPRNTTLLIFHNGMSTCHLFMLHMNLDLSKDTEYHCSGSSQDMLILNYDLDRSLQAGCHVPTAPRNTPTGPSFGWPPACVCSASAERSPARLPTAPCTQRLSPWASLPSSGVTGGPSESPAQKPFCSPRSPARTHRPRDTLVEAARGAAGVASEPAHACRINTPNWVNVRFSAC